MNVIGHRGAAGIAPENTLAGFEKAISLGADMIEFDVHLTKDDVLVVIHDPTVDRTTDGSGSVAELTLDEIKRLDAGEGQRIPTIEEAICCIQGKAKMMIELKGDGTAKAAAELIKKHNIKNDVIVISFWHGWVKEIKKIALGIKTGVLFVGNPVQPHRLAKDADADYICVNHAFLDKKLVEMAHAERIGVFTWNVDSEDDVGRIMGLEVDGIGSNYPDMLFRRISKTNPPFSKQL